MGWVTRFYLVSKCLLTKYLLAQRGRKVILRWQPRTYHVNEGWKLMSPAMRQGDKQRPPDRMTWEYSITSMKILAPNSRSYCEETSHKPTLACNLLNSSRSWKVKERLKDCSPWRWNACLHFSEMVAYVRKKLAFEVISKCLMIYIQTFNLFLNKYHIFRL